MRVAVNNNHHHNTDDIINISLSSIIYYSTKAIFSNRVYITLAVFVAAIFWLISNISNQLLFFSPSLTFYWPIPESSISSFVLSNIIADLTGIVVSMTLYMYGHSTDKVKNGNKKMKNAGGRHHRRHRHLTSLLVSSFSSIGVISSICAGCSYSVSLFLFAFILGGSGSGMIGGGAAATGPAAGTATMLTSLLSTYHIPL